jgi:hypothetical protein
MIHKNAVGKIDPHRLTPVRGPSTELDPHIDSCELDDLLQELIYVDQFYLLHSYVSCGLLILNFN